MVEKPTYEELEQKVKELEKVVSKPKLAKQALRESEKRFNTFLDNLGDIAYESDSSGNVTYANKMSEKITGLPLKDIVGKPFLSFFTKKSQKTAIDVYQRTLQGESPEYALTFANGRVCHFKNEPLRDDNGDIIGVFGIAQDVTERKQADEALQKAYDKLEQKVDERTAELVTANEQLKQKIEVSKRAEEALKKSEKELSVISRITEIFIKVPDDKMYFEVLQIVLEVMESPYGTFAYINKDGDRVVPVLTRDIWVNCKVQDVDPVFPRERWSGIWGKCLINKETVSSSGPFRVPEGHIPVTKAMAVPIIHKGEAIGNFMVGNKTTDYCEKDKELLESIADYLAPVLHARLQRDRHEEERKQTEEKYRSLVEFSKDSIYLLERNLRYLFVNKKYLSRFNLPIDKVKGRTYGDFHSKAVTQDFTVKVHKVFETGQSLSYEYQSERDGKYFIRTLSPVKEQSGRTLSVTVISKDITELKRAEINLRQTNEELSREHNQRKILSKRLIDLLEKDRHEIAMELHDHIGQILTSLKLNLEVVDDLLKPVDTELEFHIKAAKEKAIYAIKEIKNVSHGLRPGMLDALGLVSSLEELFSEIQKSSDMQIKFFTQNVPKRFTPEKELAIYRIVQEALNNIVKYAKAKYVFVNLVKKGRALSLSVEDDGIGFDQDRAMKTTRTKGPLGLLIMRERAIQFDGEFTIESQIGKGTYVLVGIPL